MTVGGAFNRNDGYLGFSKSQYAVTVNEHGSETDAAQRNSFSYSHFSNCDMSNHLLKGLYLKRTVDYARSQCKIN